jgi:hypothetical protein
MYPFGQWEAVIEKKRKAFHARTYFLRRGELSARGLKKSQKVRRVMWLFNVIVFQSQTIRSHFFKAMSSVSK